MLSQYKPLITVKQASKQLGIKVSELNTLIADKVIETSNRGSKTLYVNNLSLAVYKAKSYKVAVKKAIHEAKVDIVFEKYNLLVAIEKNTLPETFQPAYDKERAKLKKEIAETVDNFLSLSDTEYKQFLEKPLSDIIDTTELRNLITMAKGGSVVFKNPSNTEILSMGAIIEKFNTNNTLLKKLLKKGFTTEILDKYYEQDSETLKEINNEGIKFDITNNKNIQFIEFFKTYKSIKKAYDTKIAYPLDKSVVAEIEKTLKAKFHIQEVS